MIRCGRVLRAPVDRLAEAPVAACTPLQDRSPRRSDHRPLRRRIAGSVVRCRGCSRRPTPRRPPAARRRHGQGRRPGARDRGERAPDLRRQPDRLARADRAAGRAGRLPRRLARATTSGRSRSMPRTSSTWPARSRGFFERSVELLASELRAAPGFLGRFVNVHIGSHRGAGVEAGIARLADGVGGGSRGLTRVGRGGRAATRTGRQPTAAPPMLVLENSAGSGFGPRDDRRRARRHRRRRSRRRGLPVTRVGFCLDTAHAWGAGIDVARPGRHRRLPGRLRCADRARAPGHGPPQRFAVRARLAARPTRAPRRGADRRGGLGHLLRHPALAHATLLPRDARHGRGLRRDQHRPGATTRRRAGRSPPCHRRR